MYLTKQRNFKSGLSRFNAVLLREKKRYNIRRSSLLFLTEQAVQKSTLKAKARSDASTRSFYLKRLQCNWRFRIFCKRESSEQRLTNRMATTYGEDCVIFYGNWSGRSKLKGCKPSPTSAGWKEILRSGGKTSVTCNLCKSKLCKYRKKNGNLSRARLCCTHCRLNEKRSKQFVDRDINAAKNW